MEETQTVIKYLKPSSHYGILPYMEGISKLKGTQFEFSALLIVIAIEIFWRITGTVEIIEIYGENHELFFAWSLRALYFVLIGWYGTKRLSYDYKKMAAIGFYRGGFMGIVIGLFELIWYHNVNAFIFLIALPWQTMFVGYVLVGLVGYVLSLRKEEKKEYLQK